MHDWKPFHDWGHILQLNNWVTHYSKLRELAEVIGLPNYAVVATNTKRYEHWLQSDRGEQARMKEVSQLLNCEM
jgi:hypothetical protein